MKVKTALFIGRFQPFHYGHVDAIAQAKKQWVKKFLIGIGSSNKEHTIDNPFTYNERKTMITALLKSMKIDFAVYPIPDVDNDKAWRTYIFEYLPHFDLVMSANSRTTGIFREIKFPLMTLRILKDIKSTTIRHLICIGDRVGLQELLPKPIFASLISLHAHKRMQHLYRQEHLWPSLAVDGIIYTSKKDIVIIQRKDHPLGYALPGWFVEYGETPEEALIREMKEEIGVKVRIQKLVGVYGSPVRDPRGHTVSAVYTATIVSGTLKAGDDAKTLMTVPLSQAKKMKLVFDHTAILHTL